MNTLYRPHPAQRKSRHISPITFRRLLFWKWDTFNVYKYVYNWTFQIYLSVEMNIIYNFLILFLFYTEVAYGYSNAGYNDHMGER